MMLDRSHASRQPCAPTFEPLEDRLLLDGAAPGLASALPSYYEMTGTALTLPIDAYDTDSDYIDITVTPSDQAVTAYVPTGNRFAELHFTTHDGIDMGHILVELFDGRAATAADRFVTLAENEVLPDGTLDPAGTPYYTDVIVHRVVPDFMIQMGDAEFGDGTGGSPLGDFPDEFDPALDFTLPGVLAMANSGPDTNDSQFFITDGPTPWLNQMHVIFGQMISGQSVYDALIDQPRDANNRPDDPALLTSVTIVDNPYAGTVTLTAPDDFGGDVDVNIHLEDPEGNYSDHVITISLPGNRPEIDDPGDLDALPGQTNTYTVNVVDDGGRTLITTATASRLDVTVDWDPDTGQLDVETPADFTGMFTVTLTAVEDGFEGAVLVPYSQTFYVMCTNPGVPVTLGPRLPATEGADLRGLFRDGDLLYVAAENTGLEIWNLAADPPELLGTYDTPGMAWDVKVVNGTAFVADIWEGMVSLDVSDPTDIQPLDTVTFAGPAISITLQGDTAFVPLHSGGVASVDISDPANMVVKQTLSQLVKGFSISEAIALAVNGGYAYLSDAAGGVIVLKISKGWKLSFASAFGTGGIPWGLDVADSRLYVADQNIGLIVYDLKNAKKPKFLGWVSLAGDPWHVAVVNQTAVVSGATGFSFVDVSDPRGLDAGDIEYTFTTPTVGSRGVLTGTTLALPVQNDGVVLMDVTEFTHRITAHGKYTFTDDNGVQVTLNPKKASVRVYTSGPATGHIQNLVVMPHAPNANVTVTTRGGATTADGLDIIGPMNSFTGKTLNLDGDVVTDAIKKLTLGDIHISEFNIGAPANAKDTLTMTLGRVSGLGVTSQTPIKSLTVVDWLETDGPDIVEAPWLGKLTAKGDKKRGIVGDFEGALALTGAGATKATLGSAKIAGDLRDCTWDIIGHMGKLTVVGMARNMTVRTTHNMRLTGRHRSRRRPPCRRRRLRQPHRHHQVGQDQGTQVAAARAGPVVRRQQLLGRIHRVGVAAEPRLRQRRRGVRPVRPRHRHGQGDQVRQVRQQVHRPDVAVPAEGRLGVRRPGRPDDRSPLIVRDLCEYCAAALRGRRVRLRACGRVGLPWITEVTKPPERRGWLNVQGDRGIRASVCERRCPSTRARSRYEDHAGDVDDRGHCGNHDCDRRGGLRAATHLPARRGAGQIAGGFQRRAPAGRAGQGYRRAARGGARRQGGARPVPRAGAMVAQGQLHPVGAGLVPAQRE
jgi:peptidyl-prolyl cis-trans isomerase A (cyclophilin A)